MPTATSFPEICTPHEHSSVRTLKRTVPSNPVAIPYVAPAVLQGLPSAVPPNLRKLKSHSSPAQIRVQLPPLVGAPSPRPSLSPSLSHHDSDPTGSASTSSSGTAGTTEPSGPPTTRRRSTPGRGPQKLDTELARKGSNFGLPIALQLTRIMNGAVGIVSVSHTVTS
jgi:hypothetical protein